MLTLEAVCEITELVKELLRNGREMTLKRADAWLHRRKRYRVPEERYYLADDGNIYFTGYVIYQARIEYVS